MLDLHEGVLVAERYRIVRELARGGMGVVYVATDTKFDLPIALKVAGGREVGQAPAIRARFRQEARLANILGRSPGFVRVNDWGEVEPNGRLYLAMDLVKGGRELDLGAGGLAARLELLLEAARIVARAHELGVIHRDLKPANFLVDGEGRLHLTDFGIAKQVGVEEEPTAGMGLTLTGTAMGTPYYMAPEQFEDAKTVDVRADVYSLGVMLFLALAGRVPFTGDNPSQVLATQMRVRFEGKQPPRPRDFAKDLPPGLDEVCARAIALDPARRYAKADDLIDAIEATGWRSKVAAGPARASGRVAGSGSNLATVLEPPPTGGAEAAGPARDAPTEVAGPRGDTTATSPGTPRTCPACGFRGLRGGMCSQCGVDVDAHEAAVQRRQKKAHEERAQATISTAPAPPLPPPRFGAEHGAGIQYDSGIAIPKSVWFVLGAMVMVAVGVSLMPKAGGTRGPRPTTVAAAPGTGGPARPRERPLALEDMPEEDRWQVAFVGDLHRAWRAKAAADPELASTEDMWSVLAAHADLERAAISLQVRCHRDGDQAVTEAEAKGWTLRARGDGPVEVVVPLE